MSGSSLFSCCDCCFVTDKAKKSQEFQSQEVALLSKVTPQSTFHPEKVFEFQQSRPVFTVHPQIPVASRQPYTQSAELSNSFESSTGPELKSNSFEIVGGVLQNRDLLPTLEYSLYYDIQRRVLSVHLNQCFHLDPQGSHKGLISSYVVIFLLPNKDEVLESKVVERSLDPLFNQTFEFSGIQLFELRQQTLVFRIYRRDKLLSNSLIGSVVVKLEQADLYNQTLVAMIDDKTEGKVGSIGEVLFSLTFSPQSSLLQGVLLKVANLQRKDVLGAVDPYVLVSLLQGPTRKEKWRSTTKKGSIMAVYNEPFQFGVGSCSISDVVLEFAVMNYDRFGRDDAIGKVSLGLNVNSDTGRTHWSEVLSSPGHAVSRWHVLQSL